MLKESINKHIKLASDNLCFNRKRRATLTILKDKIVELRNQKALTQKEFAIACGLSSSVISQYEQGFRNPSNKALYSICEAFEIEPSYFHLPPKIEYIKKEKGGGLMGLQERLIANQLDQIDELTKQNAILQEKLTKKAKEISSTDVERYASELNANADFAEISEFANQMSLQWDYVFDNIQQPLSVARKGILRSVNKYSLKQFGYKKDDMVGKPILHFIHPDEKEECTQAIKTNQRNRAWRILKANGHYCRVEIKAHSFGNAENEFNLALMKCLDDGCTDCD